MVRANLKLRRFTRHTVFRIRRTSLGEKSRCFYLLLDRCTIMPSTQLVEAFLTRLHSVLTELESANPVLRTENRVRMRGILLKGIYFRWTRLLCYLRKALKDRLFGEQHTTWHRVGPPNNSVFCWELATIA